jgi:hypothetical protein
MAFTLGRLVESLGPSTPHMLVDLFLLLWLMAIGLLSFSKFPHFYLNNFFQSTFRKIPRRRIKLLSAGSMD